MLEIKSLIRQLNKYPSNHFIRHVPETEEEKSGLEIVDINGRLEGFIHINNSPNVQPDPTTK